MFVSRLRSRLEPDQCCCRPSSDKPANCTGGLRESVRASAWALTRHAGATGALVSWQGQAMRLTPLLRTEGRWWRRPVDVAGCQLVGRAKSCWLALSLGRGNGRPAGCQQSPCSSRKTSSWIQAGGSREAASSLMIQYTAPIGAYGIGKSHPRTSGRWATGPGACRFSSIPSGMKNTRSVPNALMAFKA